MTDMRIDYFVKDFATAVLKGKAALFVGSGLSRPVLPGWKEILKDCAAEIGLCVNREENDLIALAQYYVNDKGQRTKITETVKEFFSDKKAKPTENHFLLADLSITSIWTTNYDRLIERAHESKRITYTVITDDKSYRNVDGWAKVAIHKIHGDVIDADNVVITRSDYEEFESSHDIVLSELKGELCSKSFLFLGYSFNDTDIQHILTKIRLLHDSRNPQRHYCIFQKVKRILPNVDKNIIGDSDEDFEYKCKKQNHLISDFSTYGINPILVDDYNEVQSILKSINQLVLLKNVLICGAYEEEYVHASRSKLCAQKIAAELICDDFKIFTGYGKNLGAEIVAGAFIGCTKASKEVKDFNEVVFLFPFPYQRNMDETERKNLYTRLRQNMVSKTQITIVIAGQKKNAQSLGTIEEVELSKQHGNLIIPIASTGGIALTVWDEINKSNIPYAKSQEFQALGTAVADDEICSIVKKIINKYMNNKL